MTKAELIDRIARSRDLPPDTSKKLIGQILGVAFDELAGYFARSRVTRSQSPRFTFPHFGTFTKKRRSARRGVNPRTLEPIQIGACNTVDFRVSRELRDAMNPSPKAGGAEAIEVEVAVPVPVKRRAKTKKATETKKKSAKTKASTAKSGAAVAGRTTTKTRAAVKSRRSGGATGSEGPAPEPIVPGEGLSSRPNPAGDHAEPGPTDSDSRDKLPASPMQRVKGRRRARSRGAG